MHCAIVFAGLMFGILAAVVSHKMDPKVYIAADVEQVLGFAPLAQLPDFDEVSDGVAEEHLLRAIDGDRVCAQTGQPEELHLYRRRRGDRSHDAGAQGERNAGGDGQDDGACGCLRNAGAGTAPQFRWKWGNRRWLPLRGSRSSALVRQMAEETETQEGSLVLTDTAPLRRFRGD